jgi:hypothetical protein
VDLCIREHHTRLCRILYGKFRLAALHKHRYAEVSCETVHFPIIMTNQKKDSLGNCPTLLATTRWLAKPTADDMVGGLLNSSTDNAGSPFLPAALCTGLDALLAASGHTPQYQSPSSHGF